VYNEFTRALHDFIKEILRKEFVMKIDTKKIVLCALFTALVTVSTMVIQIPSPMSGYVNLGDVFVLFGAFFLGPLLGAVSAGLGSMIADFATGYAIYAPASFLIKATMAVVAGLIFKSFNKRTKHAVVGVIIAGVIAELIMVAGYFGYSALIMGEGIAAAASIPGNLIQGAVGIAVSAVLFVALKNTKLFMVA